MRRLVALAACLTVLAVAAARAADSPPATDATFAPDAAAAPLAAAPEFVAPPASLLAPVDLQARGISSFGDSASAPRKGRRAAAPRPPASDGLGLGPERARILLRSLTVPGWGQASLGHRHAAGFFVAAELGIWTAFGAFEVQQAMRTQTYLRTARLDAGIDLSGHDEEYRRIVGAFASSDEYNLYVVARDAANLYMQDPYHPDMAGYRAYIAAHSIGGANAWHWDSYADFVNYRTQRKDAQRAGIRANTALAIAIANRLVSALHAMRAAGHVKAADAGHTSWNVEFAPGPLDQPGAFRAGVSAHF